MSAIKKPELPVLPMTGNDAFSYCYQLLGTSKEKRRAGIWEKANEAARHVAVRLVNMNKAMAAEPLSSFDAIERQAIAQNCFAFARELELIGKAMQGGRSPDRSGGDRQRDPDELGVASGSVH